MYPAKTRISLGIRPVYRVFAVRMKKAWVLSYPLSGQWRLWSDWADAQADLSLPWAHSHFVGFVMSRLICVIMYRQREHLILPASLGLWRLKKTQNMFHFRRIWQLRIWKKYWMIWKLERNLKLVHSKWTSKVHLVSMRTRCFRYFSRKPEVHPIISIVVNFFLKM